MLKIVSGAYIIVVIVLSLVPVSSTIGAGYSDKIAHFIAYGGMGVLAYFGTDSLRKRSYLFLSIIALGVLMEGLQFYIPGRSASYLDILANAGGALFGFGISLMFTMSMESPRFGGCGSPRTTVVVRHGEDEKNT